jgi:hypothetical protein
LEFKRYLRNIKRGADLKEEAGNLFKHGDFEAAGKKFKECLDIDPLNVAFNSTIYMNLAICKYSILTT